MPPKKAPRKSVRKSAKTATRKKASATPASPDAVPSAREQLSEYRKKRDFSRTAEPEGGAAKKKPLKKLEFVIQKHAASHLHYDLRLELDGVMKSWAVPKGPAPDPSIKRLAMQVEDHPVEYNTFEGTIPQGEYGGGTVMLWDNGWYEPEKGGGEDGVRAGYRKGDLKMVFHGKRMKGSWVLVRTRGWGSSSSSSKPSWLLIKHRDEHAESGDALIERFTTSVITKRTMEQIGGSVKQRVWHSNRAGGGDDDAPALPRRKTISVAEARAARAEGRGMTQSLAHIALVVRDYDEAIAWFTQKLGFAVVEDSPREGGKRFVRVAPAASERGASLLLARAATPEQEARIGNQTGGRVFLFLHTDDFDGDYERMRGRGVSFVEAPRHEEYGKVVVFTDLYGNKWDLVERLPSAQPQP